MKIYLVGGAVRNYLLNLPIKDRDWVVIGSSPKQMIQHGYIQVGKNFPVFIHPITREEYALARIDTKIKKGYTGFECNTNSQITLKQDLKRRDLTINAIALDPLTKKLYDPYHGSIDLKLKIIRHVSEAFGEDPLRVLRVARFAAQLYYLNFHIAHETLNLMKKISNSNELLTISPERIWEETEKALIVNNPEIYFHILYKCHALKIIFPEFYKLYFLPISPCNLNHKPVKLSVAIHSLQCLKLISKFTQNIDSRFAALCHDIGKIKILEFLHNKHHFDYKFHDKYGILIIENLCNRLHIPNYIKNFTKLLIEVHTLINDIQNLSINKCLQLLNKIDIWRKPKLLLKILKICEINFIINNYKQHNNIKYNLIFLPKLYLNKICKLLLNLNLKDSINKFLHHIKSNFNILQKGIFIKQIVMKKRSRILQQWLNWLSLH